MVRGFMRLVAAALAAEIRAIAHIRALLRAKTILRSLSLNQQWSSVKCSSLMNRLTCLLASAMGCCDTSEVNSGPRFFASTAWFHTASSMPRLANQLNSGV